MARMYLDVHNNMLWRWSACKFGTKRHSKLEQVYFTHGIRVSQKRCLIMNIIRNRKWKIHNTGKEDFKRQTVKQFVWLRLLRGQFVSRVL